jgi:hypothetical protein
VRRHERALDELAHLREAGVARHLQRHPAPARVGVNRQDDDAESADGDVRAPSRHSALRTWAMSPNNMHPAIASVNSSSSYSSFCFVIDVVTNGTNTGSAPLT